MANLAKITLKKYWIKTDVQSGVSYLLHGFFMFFHASCEDLPGQ